MKRRLLRSIAIASSLRCGIVLLVLLTVATVIGGILPQSPVTPNADALYRSYGVFWHRLITRLSLDDVFHSVWFYVLTGVFALNLALCSARRVQRSISSLIRFPCDISMKRAGADTHQLSVNGMSERTIQQVLRRVGFRRIAHSGDKQLVARRHGWSVLAPDVVHAGILVILIGALLGILRQEGTFIVNELEIGLRIPTCADLSDAASTDCIPLPYDVRVDDFGVETYSDGVRVKDYWAELSFFQDEAVVRQGRISVNHPLTIAGFGFYPWRYGDDTQAAHVRLQVFEPSVNAVTSEVELRIGETTMIPNTQSWLTALHFYRTFALDQEGNPMDLGDVEGGYSAVLIQVVGRNEAGEDIAYRDLALPFLADSAAAVPQMFILADAAIPAFLELHYARNPGYAVVCAGFIVVMLGLGTALYFRPTKIRVAIEPTTVRLQIQGRGTSKALQQITEAILEAHEEGD